MDETGFSARRVLYALLAAAATIAAGAVAFRIALHETWFQSFYRAVVTASLTGLDTVPRNDAARAISIILVLGGVSIFAYVASVVVEGIARGVFSGALAEKRRRRAIEQLRDHYIICGYGRVGRRVAEEFRNAGVPYVVLDFSEGAIAAAREHGGEDGERGGDPAAAERVLHGASIVGRGRGASGAPAQHPPGP